MLSMFSGEEENGDRLGRRGREKQMLTGCGVGLWG